MVQFASALPLIFNGTSMSDGQELSNDGRVTSRKCMKKRKTALASYGWFVLVVKPRLLNFKITLIRLIIKENFI